MPPDDLERRLAAAAPREPDPALRRSVLATVDAELAVRPRPLDRWLSRRWPWATAAALLVALASAVCAEEAGHESRRAALRGNALPPATPAQIARRRAMDEISKLLGEEPGARELRRRLDWRPIPKEPPGPGIPGRRRP